MDHTLFSRANDLAEQMRHFRFYYYGPSMAAAVTFTVLFALATVLHAYQLVRSRTWFMIPFAVGAILETVGYIGRILSAQENPGPYDKIPYIIQSLLLLLAPLFFAASVYMELGRIVLMIDGDKLLFIRRTWLTKIFVIGDVVTFFIQATGSSMMAAKGNDAAEKVKIGNWAVIGGLGLQLAFFGFFVVAVSTFHFRTAQNPTARACERPWVKHMAGLYIVSTLILVRSTMRLIEFIQGYDGYIMTHEAFLYGFDAVPMFLAVMTMNVIHPGEVARYLQETAGVEKGNYQRVDVEAV